MVIVSRKNLAMNLRTYGEESLAEEAAAFSDEQMNQIGQRAEWWLYNGPKKASGSTMFIATALTLATIEVIEGQYRQPRWKRRKLKGIYKAYPESLVDDIKRAWDHQITRRNRVDK